MSCNSPDLAAEVRKVLVNAYVPAEHVLVENLPKLSLPVRALVLSGGGSHGAYEVGALRRLMVGEGKTYDVLCGVSVGAINAAFLAQYGAGREAQGQRDLEALWGTVDDSKVKQNWTWGPVEAVLSKPSVYDSSPLQAWIRGALSQPAFAASGKKLRVSATSWDSGELYTADETFPNVADWVIASSAFPCMLSPISIDGQLWADGGLRRVTPLQQAIAAGATEIDCIVCSDPYASDPYSPAGKTAFDLLQRALDILTDQVGRADFEGVDLSKVAFRELKPSVPLSSFQTSLSFDPAGVAKMIALGYADASKLP